MFETAIPVHKPNICFFSGATEMLTIILGINLSPDMNLNVRTTYDRLRAEVQTSVSREKVTKHRYRSHILVDFLTL